MLSPINTSAVAALALAVLSSPVSEAASVTLGVTNDTFIQTDGGSGGTVYGATGSPQVTELWNYHNGGAWVAIPLFYFELSSYAGQTVAEDSTFTLTVIAASGSTSRTLALQTMTAGFNPQTASFNNTASATAGTTISS